MSRPGADRFASGGHSGASGSEVSLSPARHSTHSRASSEAASLFSSSTHGSYLSSGGPSHTPIKLFSPAASLSGPGKEKDRTTSLECPATAQSDYRSTAGSDHSSFLRPSTSEQNLKLKDQEEILVRHPSATMGRRVGDLAAFFESGGAKSNSDAAKSVGSVSPGKLSVGLPARTPCLCCKWKWQPYRQRLRYRRRLASTPYSPPRSPLVPEAHSDLLPLPKARPAEPGALSRVRIEAVPPLRFSGSQNYRSDGWSEAGRSGASETARSGASKTYRSETARSAAPSKTARSGASETARSGVSGGSYRSETTRTGAGETYRSETPTYRSEAPTYRSETPTYRSESPYWSETPRSAAPTYRSGGAGTQTYRSDGGSETYRSEGGSQTYRSDGGSQTYRSDGGSQTYRSDGGSQTYQSDRASEVESETYQSEGAGSQTYRSDGGSQTHSSDGASQTHRSDGGSQTHCSGGGSQTYRSGAGSETYQSDSGSEAGLSVLGSEIYRSEAARSADSETARSQTYRSNGGSDTYRTETYRAPSEAPTARTETYRSQSRSQSRPRSVASGTYTAGSETYRSEGSYHSGSETYKTHGSDTYRESESRAKTPRPDAYTDTESETYRAGSGSEGGASGFLSQLYPRESDAETLTGRSPVFAWSIGERGSYHSQNRSEGAYSQSRSEGTLSQGRSECSYGQGRSEGSYSQGRSDGLYAQGHSEASRIPTRSEAPRPFQGRTQPKFRHSFAMLDYLAPWDKGVVSSSLFPLSRVPNLPRTASMADFELEADIDRASGRTPAPASSSSKEDSNFFSLPPSRSRVLSSDRADSKLQ